MLESRKSFEFCFVEKNIYFRYLTKTEAQKSLFFFPYQMETIWTVFITLCHLKVVNKQNDAALRQRMISKKYMPHKAIMKEYVLIFVIAQQHLWDQLHISHKVIKSLRVLYNQRIVRGLGIFGLLRVWKASALRYLQNLAMFTFMYRIMECTRSDADTPGSGKSFSQTVQSTIFHQISSKFNFHGNGILDVPPREASCKFIT